MRESRVDASTALWAEVIRQAIRDIHVCTGRSFEDRRLRNDALEWLNSQNDEPQSFLWICDMLDLDANKIRMMSLTREGRNRLLGKDRKRRVGASVVAA